jgi:hypothetical protein
MDPCCPRATCVSSAERGVLQVQEIREARVDVSAISTRCFPVWHRSAGRGMSDGMMYAPPCSSCRRCVSLYLLASHRPRLRGFLRGVHSYT